MAKHVVKCAICGEMFDLNSVQGVRHGARRYSHQTCEPNGEIVPLLQIDENLKKLNEYIAELYGSKGNYALINRQIKTFIKENNYSYLEILNTLKYFYEIKKNKVADSNGGIGIVPFVYNDAFNYYKSLWEAQQRNEDIIPVIHTVREIKIRVPQSRMNLKLFNLDEEEFDDEE